MSEFQQLKLAIIDLLHLSKDALHVHVGLLVFVTAVLLLAGRRTWLAWLAAAAVAVGIEIVDLRDDWAGAGDPRWLASLHDVLNTLFWPTILTVLSRRLDLQPSRSPSTNRSVFPSGSST